LSAIAELLVYYADGELFHAVILQSGSALNPLSVASKPDTFLRQLTEHSALFNCTQWPTASESDQEDRLVECLQQLPVDQLVNVNFSTGSR